MLDPLADVSLLLTRLRHAARISGRAGMNCKKRQSKVEGRVPKTANEVPEAVGAQGILAQVDGPGIGIRAVAPESFWLWDAGLALC